MKVLYVVNSLTRESLVGPGDPCHHLFMQNAFRHAGCEVRRYPEPLDEGSARDSRGFSRFAYRAIQSAVPRRLSSALRAAYSLRHDERTRRDLQRVIADYEPSLVFEKYSSFQAGCARAACANRVPYAVQFHAPAEESPHYHASRWNAALLKSRMTTVGTLATAVVTVSRYLRDYLVRLGVPGDKILVLPNGVDLASFPDAGRDESVRRKLGVSPDAFVVGFVGTMRPWQRYDLLPEVFAAVKSSVRNAVFLLVGPFADARQEARFERQLECHGVRKDFILTGAVAPEEVPAFIHAMDVCVMPDSTDYCSPMKLFEYGACGKAVVMPRRSPILDVIRDGDNGLLFTPSSSRDMAAKIVRLARSPELRARLGNRLGGEVRSNYTYTHNVERILDHVRAHVRASRKSPSRPKRTMTPTLQTVSELQ
ncbi:MAG: glycosyltransferase family 4 protein [Phycisphaerales bacterium]